MRRLTGSVVLAALFLAAGTAAWAGGGVDLRYPDGTPVSWEKWLARQAPVALLVWSSWQPRAAEVLQRRHDLETACKSKGLRLVLVDVVEPLDAARKALDGSGITWLHDRHGSVLKQCRIAAVPAIVILDSTGKVLARLEATPRAILGWNGP